MDDSANTLFDARRAVPADRGFLRNISGASNVEFAVITALIAFAAMLAITDLGSAVASMLN